MDWIRQLAAKHTLEVMPHLYYKTLKKYETIHGYTYASAFDALNIAHANGVDIVEGLENGTLRLITANGRYALINLKKEDEKMMNINVTLTESQIEELIQNVNIVDYVDYQHMEDWDYYMSMSDATAIEIIDSIDKDHFNTSDKYAVVNGSGYWISTNSLEEIIEPFIDDMLQDYLDMTLQ